MSLARSILIFVGAFVFSALLWAYVRLSAAYEADVDLPAKLTAPKGFALASGLPDRLHARVRGAGWQILLMNFTKNANFRFDLSDRSVVAPSLVLHSDEIVNAALLPSELRVLKVDPDSLQLQFGKAIEKRLAIEPRLDVVPAPGYTLVGGPKVSPRSVAVEGSANVLDSLSSIATQPFSMHNVKEDVEASLSLSDSLDNFVTVPNEPKVAVHVSVQALGERRMTNIPVSVEALPPQYDLVLIPSSVNVVVRGGVQDLAKLSPTGLRAHVMYTPLVFDTARAVMPVIDVPKGLEFLSSDPPAVRFILRRKPEVPVMPKHSVRSHAAP